MDGSPDAAAAALRTWEERSYLVRAGATDQAELEIVDHEHLQRV
jgi:hypothetical protein